LGPSRNRSRIVGRREHCGGIGGGEKREKTISGGTKKGRKKTVVRYFSRKGNQE